MLILFAILILQCVPDIAAGVLVLEWSEGWFTGRKLIDYFKGEHALIGLMLGRSSMAATRPS